MDVLSQPVTVGLIRVGNKRTSVELAHLAPISAHAIDGDGTGGHKGSIQVFTFAQLAGPSRAFDTFPATNDHETYQLYLVGGPNSRFRHLNRHHCNQLPGFLQRYADGGLYLRRAV